MDIVHLQTSTKFTCETCGVERTNKVSFEDHVRIHFQTAKTEICIKCGKPFLTEIQLKSHFRTSHGETKYKCDVCDYSTNLKNVKQVHKTIHSVLLTQKIKSPETEY